MSETKTIDKIKLIFIIILIVSLGLFSINQFLGWYYKMELLNSPCDLCVELNPDLEFRLKPFMFDQDNIIIFDKNNIIINNFSIP